MGNNELFKGQIDGIILFVLSKANRHTDELKQIIDEKFSTVKIGTLYSVITRLKTQKLISEYRASSVDGSRRKYYQLTDNGKAVFEEKYKDLFSGIYIESPAPVINEKTEAIKEETVEQVETTVIDAKTDYASYVKPNAFEETIEDIDFSAFEDNSNNPPIIEDQPKEEKSSDFIPYLEPTVLPSNINEEQPVNQSKIYEKDYDSIINSEYNYKDVLDELFPKPKVKKVEIFEETTQEDVKTETIEIKENVTNWNDVYELAEKDGIKIKISSDTNRYQGSKILINRLNLFTSLITLGAVLLAYLILTAISGVPFNGSKFGAILGIFGGITAIMLIIFALSPHNKIKDLPRFINVIEIALIITISTIIICFATAAIQEIDFKNATEVFNSLILPSAISLSIPVFFIVQYLLSKLDFFQSF